MKDMRKIVEYHVKKIKGRRDFNEDNHDDAYNIDGSKINHVILHELEGSVIAVKTYFNSDMNVYVISVLFNLENNPIFSLSNLKGEETIIFVTESITQTMYDNRYVNGYFNGHSFVGQVNNAEIKESKISNELLKDFKCVKLSDYFKKSKK